jgi:hypothetical protein
MYIVYKTVNTINGHYYETIRKIKETKLRRKLNMNSGTFDGNPLVIPVVAL